MSRSIRSALSGPASSNTMRPCALTIQLCGGLGAPSWRSNSPSASTREVQ
jgi:hypothetical protein